MLRNLHLRDARDVSVPVRVHAPKPEASDWSCRVEIGWPGRPWTRDITGIDAIDALDLALRMVGTELYCSDLHTEGQLVWLEPGEGYGFPVPRIMADLLVGQDRARFG